jgi:glycosyltransferase involved in cell wall biosynthesis
MMISVVIITYNEEANLARTLESVKPLVRDGQGEIIVVDSGSTDRTAEIAKLHGAKLFVEAWKGFAAQKNSAIEKAAGDWILSLDADEELEPALQQSLAETLHALEQLKAARGQTDAHPLTIEDAERDVKLHMGSIPGENFAGFWIPRKNEFLGHWIKHGGFWPDPKLRLFRRGTASFENRPVHETVKIHGETTRIREGALLHHSYPTVSDYIEHMDRYSSLGAQMVVTGGAQPFLFLHIIFRPALTFLYNYLFRLGFLDGRIGLQFHLHHAVYVFWKYAKAWELRSSGKAENREL